MHLTLSKEFVTNPFFDGDKIIKRYTVSDEGKLIGQFFYSPKECYFTYDDKKIRLHIKRPFLRLPKVSVIDETSNAIIGKYRLTNPRIFAGYRDRLTLDGKVYAFRNLPSGVKYSLFKRSTWYHFKFSLTCGREDVVYTFKLDKPARSFGYMRPEIPFKGSIDVTGGNKLLMLAGLYLVERALDVDDD